MTSINRIILLLTVLCVACSFKTQVHNFDFDNSEFVKLNAVQLNGKQIQRLESALNGLKRLKNEIYSKPSDVITFTIDGEIRFISIFAKEKLVFNGYYLDAWTERMEGRESKGLELNSGLRDLIDELKSDYDGVNDSP